MEMESEPPFEDCSSPSPSPSFSSCDEGADPERYCSANSALGSASLCSSIGHHADFFLDESFKAFNFNASLDDDPSSSSSDGATARDKNSRRRRRIGDAVAASGSEDGGSKENSSPPPPSDHFEFLSQGVELSLGSLPPIRTGSRSNQRRNYSSSSLDRQEPRVVVSSPKGERPQSTTQVTDDEGEPMLDYGTDDDAAICSHATKRMQRLAAETKVEFGNPLLMNSSVAFGSDDWDDFIRESEGGGVASLNLYDDRPTWPQMGSSEINGLPSLPTTTSNHVLDPLCVRIERHDEGVRDIAERRFRQTDPWRRNGGIIPVENACSDYPASHAQEPPLEEHTKDCNEWVMHGGPPGDLNCIEKLCRYGVDGPPEKQPSVESTPACSIPTSAGTCQVKESDESQEGDKANSASARVGDYQDASLQVSLKQMSKSNDVVEEGLKLDKVNKLDADGLFDEMVHEMEEILLDSGESRGAKFPLDNNEYTAHQSHHLRDGSSTASTSGTDDAYPLAQYLSKIDWVEVVGAKQKKGDVSFGERLVGVKEYTIYILKVWSDQNQWEIERRYRDFYALYRQLRTLFTEHGMSLPSPWTSVEPESRKIFGNASPNVVSERSNLIQECLRSILTSRYPFGMPSFLVTFLSPGRPAYNTGLLKTLIPRSLQKLGEEWYLKDSDCKETSQKDISTLGKTISLIVEIRPHKSMRQLLELQHYTCAGCHRHMDAGKTLFREFAQTIGWNKPRFCEYTGQLFCASCHTNDTAVLPARVLHRWDFSLYPVSQFAKAYLESIYDQPMLCVSAVNPFLFSKVSALLHVMGIRKKIAAMLPYIRCPFRRSIYKGLAFRRYLLESNDFFALRDLVDLSKGAFAALPIMVETIFNRILEHITEQCLVCYDAGIPCAARQDCNDPSSLIFPFQEAEAARCNSCGSIFHKHCFGRLMGCSCGKPSSTNRRIGPVEQVINGSATGLDGRVSELIQPPVYNSTPGFLSDILSKARPDKIWKPRNSSPVILMGSLPSTSL
ncbi:uncharacterized protein [Typha angustifolia]|uniref:uncharacterized protein n=1 Tax=Typha angustifolia TaxID=59011 RepID=UPI003C2DCB9D